MPLQELGPVTLNEVTESIGHLEREYSITSSEFLRNEALATEEDAAEWRYLLKQKEAIEADMMPLTLGTVLADAKPRFSLYRGSSTPKKKADRTEDELRHQYDCAA